MTIRISTLRFHIFFCWLFFSRIRKKRIILAFFRWSRKWPKNTIFKIIPEPFTSHKNIKMFWKSEMVSNLNFEFLTGIFQFPRLDEIFFSHFNVTFYRRQNLTELWILTRIFWPFNFPIFFFFLETPALEMELWFWRECVFNVLISRFFYES